MCLTALSIGTMFSCTKSDEEKEEEPTDLYVDLGLPSGTKWKNANEMGFYDYNEAIEEFGYYLPTKEQFDELKSSCQWTWDEVKRGSKVEGPNGKSIFLPAMGYKNCDGSMGYVGTYGTYWSSSHTSAELAYRLSCSSLGPYVFEDLRCMGLSIRLVQK